jgi:hypothetical protein
MLTEEEQEWCKQMVIELRIQNGAFDQCYSTMLQLGFSININ